MLEALVTFMVAAAAALSALAMRSSGGRQSKPDGEDHPPEEVTKNHGRDEA